MTDLATLIFAIATLVTAVAGLVVSLRNSSKIEKVHELTNSRMTQLVDEVRSGAHGAGVQEGRDLQAALPDNNRR